MNLTRVHGFSCRINDAKCFQVNGKTFTDPLAKQTENALVKNQTQIFCTNTKRLPPVETKPRKTPSHRHKKEFTNQPIKTTREMRLLSKLPFQEQMNLTRKIDETQRLSESRIKQIVDMDTDHCQDEKVPLRLRKLERSVEKKRNRLTEQRKMASTKQAEERHVKDTVLKKTRINPKHSTNTCRDSVAISNNTPKNDPETHNPTRDKTAETLRNINQQFSDSSDTNDHNREVRGCGNEDSLEDTGEEALTKREERAEKDRSISSTSQSPRRKIYSAEAKRKINCVIKRPGSFSIQDLEEDYDRQILNFEQYLQRLYSSPNTYALEAVQSANMSENNVPVSATKCLLHNRYLDKTIPATPLLREFTRLSNYNESDEER